MGTTTATRMLPGPARAALLALLTLLPAVHPARAATVEQRIEALERTLNSRALMGILDRVDSLQKEIQDLRGELEMQTHTLSQIKQRQRDLYLDVDRRLRRFEVAGVPDVSREDTEASGQAPSSVEPPPQTRLSIPPAVEPRPDSASFDPVQEQNAYTEAFSLLKEGRYEQATEALRTFLEKYPGGQYSDNAQYWLGEAYYVTRQFEPAMQEFQKLARQHPTSSKLTHALLKIGYIHDELGQSDEAQQVLGDLITKHPTSTAARLARNRLQRIRSDSR